MMILELFWDLIKGIFNFVWFLITSVLEMLNIEAVAVASIENLIVAGLTLFMWVFFLSFLQSIVLYIALVIVVSLVMKRLRKAEDDQNPNKAQ